MKICVLMWYDDTIKFYAQNFYKINKLYCRKNNYDIIKSSQRVYRGRHYQTIPERQPHWERFPLIIREIKKYDWVVWIDADAYFYVDAPPLEDIIEKYDKEILLSEDKERVAYPIINTGVMLLKNTKKVIDVVNTWAYSEKLKHKYTILDKQNWIEDQAMVRGCYKDNVDNLKEISVIIPYLELQHFDKREVDVLRQTTSTFGKIPKSFPYIHHLAGRPDLRYKASMQYLRHLHHQNHLDQE